MTLLLELDLETEARIGEWAASLAVTPSEFASAYIKGHVVAVDAGDGDPNRAAMEFVYEKFSKSRA